MSRLAARALERPLSRPRREGSPRPRPRAVPRARPRRARVRLGLLAVPLIAGLLAGVIYVNSAELRLTVRTGIVEREQQQVQEETNVYQARLSSQDGRVIAAAQKLGMKRLPSSEFAYLTPPGPKP